MRERDILMEPPGWRGQHSLYVPRHASARARPIPYACWVKNGVSSALILTPCPGCLPNALHTLPSDMHYHCPPLPDSLLHTLASANVTLPLPIMPWLASHCPTCNPRCAHTKPVNPCCAYMKPLNHCFAYNEAL